MQDTESQDIIRALGRLEGQVSEGFKGVHARQDTANHRTEKSEDRISSLESSRALDQGVATNRSEYINVFWLLTSSALTGIIVWIISNVKLL